MDQDWFEQCNSLDAGHQNDEKNSLKMIALAQASISQHNLIVLTDLAWEFLGHIGKEK